jgi:predicted Na+-dependent transporter
MTHKFTRNLKIYIVLLTAYSLVFFYLLHTFINNEQWTNILIIAVTFFLGIGVTTFLLERLESKRNVRLDLDFTYHLMSYVVINIIGFGWYILFRLSDLLHPMNAIGLGGWTLGLLIHYFSSRRSIKGMSKEEVFK